MQPVCPRDLRGRPIPLEEDGAPDTAWLALVMTGGLGHCSMIIL